MSTQSPCCGVSTEMYMRLSRWTELYVLRRPTIPVSPTALTKGTGREWICLLGPEETLLHIERTASPSGSSPFDSSSTGAEPNIKGRPMAPVSPHRAAEDVICSLQRSRQRCFTASHRLTPVKTVGV
ncbi:unnamed protein product [Pleuronectes platessa]|uniref:Uncharacterized protein n=1 Tax=Pleuronectes platessa TaxID=8262 RepID=A0A9N7TUR3_PLEPL|nr:unnamed protein product [Pleuronectes platessa]